ncbi:MAG: cupin, partial [Pseudodonghicola sp.]
MWGPGGAALAVLMIETDRVKVTEWRFKAWGDSTGWHRPGLDFIFSRLFNGVLDVKLADGEIMQARMQKDM